jgi:5-methylcytosine-specific restriction endonuclease McrA
MQFAARFRYVAQEVRSLLMDGSGIGLPRSRGTRSHREMHSWPWVRMEVLRRDSYCCRACGRPGDEITLQVCPAKANSELTPVLVTLCASCRRPDDHRAPPRRLLDNTIADT